MFDAYYKASAPASLDISLIEYPSAFNDTTFISPASESLKFSNHMWGQIIETVENHDGQILISTGVDFQFFDDIVPELGNLMLDKDMLAVDDVGCTCPDFMVIRCSKTVANYFRDVVSWINVPDSDNDSIQMTGRPVPFRFAKLPKTYWTIGWNTSKKEPIQVPDAIKVHHANWVVGFNAKMETLAYVRKLCAEKGIKWASEKVGVSEPE